MKATQFIELARTIQKSSWYQSQRMVLRRSEYPTLAQVIALVDMSADLKEERAIDRIHAALAALVPGDTSVFLYGPNDAEPLGDIPVNSREFAMLLIEEILKAEITNDPH